MTQRKHATARNGKPEEIKVWSKTPTSNLVRYIPKGSYYLRARVAGKIVRESLKTSNYNVAKVKLSERLAQLRESPLRPGGPETLHEAMEIVRLQIKHDPSLKANSQRSYLDYLDSMQPGKPAELPFTPLLKLSERDMAQWWAKTAAKYAPQRANHILMFVRRALKEARKAGAMVGDPAENIRRVKIKRTKLNILTLDQFALLLESIRSQKKSKEGPYWVEFMTYSGLRPAEVAALDWRDINEELGFITVTGGVHGTKNREIRHVPMVPAMRDLIQRMKAAQTVFKQRGKVFTAAKPKQALRAACKRLKLPLIRIYDLRHMFATICAQSGVDVPTFAKWLGHRDGGALAMRTYVHPHDEHSQRSAAKVQFNARDTKHENV